MKKTDEVIDFNQFKYCECGCGQPVKRRFVQGHYIRGKRFGRNNPKWKGKVKFAAHGYLEIYRLEYHHKLTNYSVKLHRFVYEYFHKCCLLSWVEIHHVNGIRCDNHKHNLMALTKSQHAKLNENRYKFRKNNKINLKNMDDRICLLCESNNTYIHNKTGYCHWYKHENGFVCKKCNYKIKRGKSSE